MKHEIIRRSGAEIEQGRSPLLPMPPRNRCIDLTTAFAAVAIVLGLIAVPGHLLLSLIFGGH